MEGLGFPCPTFYYTGILSALWRAAGGVRCATGSNIGDGPCRGRASVVVCTFTCGRGVQTYPTIIVFGRGHDRFTSDDTVVAKQLSVKQAGAVRHK